MKNIEELRKRQIYVDKKGTAKSLSFLYHTIVGRAFLSLLIKPSFTKLGGKFLNTRLSTLFITPFVKKSNIDLSEYEDKNYTSYNDFFTRKILDGKRIIYEDKNIFISPCDSKLSVYSIKKDSTFKIKNSYYKLEDLLNKDEIYKEYEEGLCLIFRLSVDDYHRYCYIDSGYQKKNIHIKGEFHTVQPISFERYNVYKRNAREYTILFTDNFDKVIEVEVGALLVGKISNHYEEYQFKKGEEKGMFEFGGSTIVLLVKKDIIDLDSDIKAIIDRDVEMSVKYGERIGIKHEKTTE